MTQQSLRQNLPGQTLVETIAAMAVAVIIITSLVGLSITSLRYSNLSQGRAVATQLVQEEIERVRIFRDLNGLPLLTSTTNTSKLVCPSSGASFYIDRDGSDNLSLSAADRKESVTVSGISFSRYFRTCVASLLSGNPAVVQVTANVDWTDSSGSRVTRVTTYLSNWR